MPALKNPRHEAFAQALFAGLFKPNLYPTQGTAYLAAGYRAKDSREPGGSAEAAASRLLKKVKIFDRVRELQAHAAERAKESVEKCVAELNELRVASVADEKPNYSAAVSAVMGKAKLLGFVTDKTDVTVKGDFSQAKSLQDIGRALLAQCGLASPSAAAVQLAIEANDAFVARLREIAEEYQGTVLEHEA